AGGLLGRGSPLRPPDLHRDRGSVFIHGILPRGLFLPSRHSRLHALPPSPFMTNSTCTSPSRDLDSFLDYIRKRDPLQPEFHQAVEEGMRSLWIFVKRNPRYSRHGLLERLVEPERVIMFRVPWVDDQGVTHVNRGY